MLHIPCSFKSIGKVSLSIRTFIDSPFIDSIDFTVGIGSL